MADRDEAAEELIQREEQLRAGRSTFEALWQQIQRYVFPNSASFTETTTPGQERTRWILDSTAPRSLEMFASFLHTLLNNPATRWIELGDEGNSEAWKTPDVRKWAEDVSDILISAMTTDTADLYSQLHQVYLNMGAYGTAALFVDVSARTRSLTIRQYHLGDCVIEEGENERVDTVLRQRNFTRRQALQRWKKEDLGKTFDDAYDSKKKRYVDTVRFLHCVVPNDDPCAEYIRARLPGPLHAAPYYSAWVNTVDRIVVEASAYEEFPYMVPRWYKAHGEVYGRSPSMTAMPDIRMINRMSDTILRGAEKIVDPPLVIPDGGLVSPVRMFPGGISYTEGQIDIKTLIPPGTSRIETGNQLLEQRQQAVRECYFVPLFVTPDNPVKTATQVLQEVDERNRAVSPMLVRMQTELFHGLVKRVYNLLLRNGVLPDLPPELADKRLTIRYVSPLIASQKQMEGLAMARLFEMLAPWAQVDNGAFDWFDIADKLPQIAHQASAAPAGILRNKSGVDDVRAARAQQQQAQQAASGALQGGEVLAKLMAAAPQPQ